jgi:hypothetical protein
MSSVASNVVNFPVFGVVAPIVGGELRSVTVFAFNHSPSVSDIGKEL